MATAKFHKGQRVWYRPLCKCETCSQWFNTQVSVTDSCYLIDRSLVHQPSTDTSEDEIVRYTGWAYVLNDSNFAVLEADLHALKEDDVMTFRMMGTNTVH